MTITIYVFYRQSLMNQAKILFTYCIPLQVESGTCGLVIGPGNTGIFDDIPGESGVVSHTRVVFFPGRLHLCSLDFLVP